MRSKKEDGKLQHY